MTNIALQFILNIMILISSLILMICIMLILTFNFIHFELIEEIVENWNKNLVKKIIIKRIENDNLIENKELILNYNFPGIIEGCIYKNNINYSYLTGLCNCKGFEDKCINVNKIEKRNLQSFYFNNKNYTIYIERFENENYTKYFFNEENYISQFCNSYYNIDCGIIDSLNNHLCLKQNNKCPYIEIENYDNSENFEFLNQIKEKFILDIKFSTDQICINNNESPLLNNISLTFPFFGDDEDLNNIIYDKCITSILNNITFDYRFVKIMEIYFNNIFPNDLKSNLLKITSFEFDKFINSKLNFFSRKFIGLKKECKDYIEFFKIFILIQNNIKFSFTIFLIIDLIVIPYFLLFILVIMQIEYDNSYLHIILSFIYSFFILLYLAMFLIEYFKMKNCYFNSIEISDKFCGDNITNSILYLIRKDSYLLMGYIFKSILLILLILISSLLKTYLILLKIKKKKIINSLMNGLNLNNQNSLITRFEMDILFE